HVHGSGRAGGDRAAGTRALWRPRRPDQLQRALSCRSGALGSRARGLQGGRMRVRVGTADGLFVLDGASERQVAGHSVTALSEDWAIFDSESVVYRANGGWRQTLTVRSPEPSLGIHGALLARSDEAIVGWGSSLTRVFK